MRSTSQVSFLAPCLVNALVLAGDAFAAAPPAPGLLDSGPLGFEANHGQAPAEVRFQVNTPRYSVRFGDRGATLRLPGGGAVRMTFPGARPAAVEGGALLARRSHYYAGEDRSGWVTDVPHYERVFYRGLYRGIDAVFHEHKGDIEYDFVVAPRADPRAVRIAFDGARRMRLDRGGDLVLLTAAGEVRQRRPVAYQEIDGRRRPVASRFVRRGRRTVGFAVGRYDRTRPLVIDPVIVHSTFERGSKAR